MLRSGGLPESMQQQQLAANVTYDEVGVTRMRKLYHQISIEEQGLLIGASWSLTAYDKLHRRASKFDPVLIVSCPLCQADVIPGWHHCAWVCSFFASNRPPEPAHVLFKRLGWAMPNEPRHATLTTLQFLGAVRAQLRPHAGFH